MFEASSSKNARSSGTRRTNAGSSSNSGKGGAIGAPEAAEKTELEEHGEERPEEGAEAAALEVANQPVPLPLDVAADANGAAAMSALGLTPCEMRVACRSHSDETATEAPRSARGAVDADVEGNRSVALVERCRDWLREA